MYNKKGRCLINILLIVVLASVLFFSCGADEKRQTDPAEYNIEVITEQELKEIISSRNGKTLFLNVWATWCVPCVEEFPAIVKLHQNYKDKNVEVIAVSVDLPSEIDDKIIPFLKKQNANFKVLVAEEKSSEKIINMLNQDWSGAIPASFIFDKAGNQKGFLLGTQNYKGMAMSIDSVQSL